MTVARKPATRKTPASTVSFADKAPSSLSHTPVAEGKKQAAPEKPARPLPKAQSASPLIPATPEASSTSSDMRTRLSKAFSRPLDKKLKKATLIRDSFTFPKGEYAQLSLLKKRLAEQGSAVKKSELIRAGLILLSALDDNNLKAILAKVPTLD